MCTLIFETPKNDFEHLTLGLNRDEMLDRPTEDYGIWLDDLSGKRWVGGKDKKSGGTWFAIGENTIAALTNHRETGRSVAGEKTRGDLVVRCATLNRVEELDGLLLTLDARHYGFFHLVVIGSNRVRTVTNRHGRFDVAEVEPGPHILGNFGLDEPSDPIVSNIHQQLIHDKRCGSNLAQPGVLKRLLSTHGQGFPCIHFGPFGTSSSAIFVRNSAGEQLFTTLGAACQAPWRDSTYLLTELRS
jgi:hypothetical protein